MVLLSVAVLESGQVSNEVGQFFGPYIHPLPVSLAVPPQAWALPVFVGVFLVVLVIATIWHVSHD
jgi:hypothetical protein